MTSVPTGLLIGDCRETLRAIPDGSVHCCVTSPPYWGLRDYGADGQIGLEHTVDQYVAEIVAVFREVRRVLRHDGTLWMNLGDSYAGSGKGGNPEESPHQKQRTNAGSRIGQTARDAARTMLAGMDRNCGFKPKDLIGVPWRVAFALQADGWYLRQDIIWHKPNPMPESVTDRCTKAHEYLFLLSKSERYYFDAKAIEEEASSASWNPANCKMPDGWATHEGGHGTFHRDGREKGRSGNVSRKAATERGCPEDGVDGNVPWEGFTRNKRSVWTIASEPMKEAHFACYPQRLVEPCIAAGTSLMGCCERCGAPRSRDFQRTKRKRERPNDLTNRTGENGTGNHCANTVAGVEVVTVGWTPGCSCGAATEPCLVLDPFMGSGTTAVVAEKMGRRWIGCELSETYAAIIRKRLAREGTPIFTEAAR